MSELTKDEGISSDDFVNLEPPKKKMLVTETVENKPKEELEEEAEDTEYYWVLSGNKRVRVRSYKGRTYIDIREFYESKGRIMPLKKGISLQPRHWRALLSVSDEINEVIKKHQRSQ